jgi:hypothetical protein
MSTKQIYNIGTTVYYEGDDVNDGGYGRITEHVTDYLDELQFVVTLEDGRVINNVSAADFEAREVLGNTQSAEFHVVDTWETETKDWDDVLSNDTGYSDENSIWHFSV